MIVFFNAFFLHFKVECFIYLVYLTILFFVLSKSISLLRSTSLINTMIKVLN
jgi:hypothetical protein